MHTDAILPARRMPLPPPPHPPVGAPARASDPASDPTEVVGGLAAIDQVRQRVAVALFGATTSPTLVGRFQVSKLLGAGGMGVVYAAHDPQLGRTVAIKLLQPMAAGERARERLQREAQAMARLQHPNVVGVFETGIHGDQVFVAMEYVEGGTLGDWLRVRPRPWTEVVDMLCQAGDGLAAAHEVGLVHRDFKPANILISGVRARISDFGLARAAADAGELERTSEDDGLLLASPLTRTGALIGTPAYMAPELLHGGAASPASDQFAFGVVLFEAVHGHRPFLGDSVPALLDAIESGKLATVAGKPAPAALTAIIRRALDRDPARRFPDMPALLTDLRAARSRGELRLGFLAGMRELPRGRALALLMSSGLALVGGLALATFSQPTASIPEIPGIPEIPEIPEIPSMLAVVSCDGEALAGVWDPARRRQLATVLPPQALGLLPALDNYAAQWTRRHGDRCASPAHAAQWPDICLADRRTALADLVQAVVDVDDDTRARAHFALELLPALADCDGPSSYTTLVSESAPEPRALRWRDRLGYADLFQLHAATRSTVVDPPATAAPNTLSAADIGKLALTLGGSNTREPRAEVELSFANAVRTLRQDLGVAPRDPHVARSGALTPLARLRSAGETADTRGFADLSARAWVLAAEVLEAGPHADDHRTQLWDLADAALTRLPGEHPLRLRLQRDLAFIAFTHARHTTPEGACFGDTIDFQRCGDLFAATRRLTAIASDPAATTTDRELLARAHEYAGNQVAATVARAHAEPLALRESELGYLDFRRAEVVPSAPSPADHVRCNADLSLCEVDRDFLASDTLLDPTAIRLMMSVKDGIPRGLKLYGIRPDTAFKLLGFKNGDLLLDLGGAPVTAADFLASFQRALTSGSATIHLERKGEAMERRFLVK